MRPPDAPPAPKHAAGKISRQLHFWVTDADYDFISSIAAENEETIAATVCRMHGIAEYTGFLLAEAVAIRGGRYLWARLSNEATNLGWPKIILAGLACYPIILLAALIEVYVTPFL